MLKWPTILVKFRWNSRLKLRISHVTPIQSTYLTFSGEYFSSPFPMLRFEFNWPLPSSKNPQFQNEAKCTTVLVKTRLISMRIKNHFHIKGWALKLVLIQRPGGTRKWPIANGWYVNNIGGGGQHDRCFSTDVTSIVDYMRLWFADLLPWQCPLKHKTFLCSMTGLFLRVIAAEPSNWLSTHSDDLFSTAPFQSSCLIKIKPNSKHLDNQSDRASTSRYFFDRHKTQFKVTWCWR